MTQALPYPGLSPDTLRGVIIARTEDLEILKNQQKAFINRIIELEVRSGNMGEIPVPPERIRDKSSKVFRQAFEAGFRGWANNPPKRWRWQDGYKDGYRAGNALALARLEKVKQYQI